MVLMVLDIKLPVDYPLIGNKVLDSALINQENRVKIVTRDVEHPDAH